MGSVSRRIRRNIIRNGYTKVRGGGMLSVEAPVSMGKAPTSSGIKDIAYILLLTAVCVLAAYAFTNL